MFTAKVPAIELKEGETVYESLVTVEYLDDVFPQRPLLPKDPLKRAFDKIIIEALGPVSNIYQARCAQSSRLKSFDYLPIFKNKRRFSIRKYQ